MKHRKLFTVVIFSVMALVLLVPAVAFAAPSQNSNAAPMSGAIWTTNQDGSAVNKNIYVYKNEVYLNGGPKATNSPGLPDGMYYVMVTEPNGTVLGHTADDNFMVEVKDGRFVQIYRLWDIVFKASSDFTVMGYDTTTNPGHEYKVWLSMDRNFPNRASKTDNFKVLKECPPSPCQCP